MAFDFVVFGVPRSGTTAAAEALNLHPRVMCGIEYLPSNTAHRYQLPAAFENEDIVHSWNCKVTRDIYVGKRRTAHVFGNKDPRFYFYLKDFRRHLPLTKQICIYRPNLGFWNSWNIRANNHADRSWERGQTGFFGVLELFCLLSIISDIANAGEVLIVNYESLFFSDPNTLESILTYLGVDRDDNTTAAFRANLFAPKGIERAVVNSEANAVSDYLRLPQFEREVFGQPIVTNVNVRAFLRDYCREVRPLIAELLDDRFSRFFATELAYFLGAQRLRAELEKIEIKSRALNALADKVVPTEVIRQGLNEIRARFEDADR